NASLSDGTFATVGAGLQTAVAEADTTSEPAATRTPKPSSGTEAGSTLYSDNFDDEQSSDFTAETNQGSVYKFVDGAYKITVTKPKLLSWATMKGDYGDAAISVDASIDGPPASAAGLIFHYQDDKNFYIYSIDGEGRYELDVYKDDKPTTLVEWTESAAIKPAGELNTLRVETSGDAIRLYVNDALLDEVSDSTIANGKAALVVNTFDDPNVTVTFDNLFVRAIK
ncbi:MAG: family 16 glycoside hydrolase, partial [Roseiflexaceae bacterium]